MSRLDYNAEESELRSRADHLRSEADALTAQAEETRKGRDRRRPLLDRLVFAATWRCSCGAGMAYDPTGEVGDETGPFRRPSAWECSDILRFSTFDAEKQAEVRKAEHLGPHSFATWDAKSEDQPSANGASTRPAEEPTP